jgi:energy-coupling factor transport system ATP-binding protein
VQVKSAFFAYGKRGKDVLRGLSLDVPRGEIYALLGGNGGGKTTLLSVIGGVLTPYSGGVRLFGKVLDGYKKSERYGGLIACLPQSPEALFTKESVAEELREMTGDASEIERVTKETGLRAELLSAHPFDLSGGEMQRAALAKVLLCRPKILLADEPTKGMDRAGREAFCAVLRGLRERGVTVIAATHDLDFAAGAADRCGLMFGGEIVAEGAPREFFGGNRFYTTAAGIMARAIGSDAVTVGELISELRERRGHD